MYFHSISKAESMGRTSMLAWILVLCFLSMAPVNSQYHFQTRPYVPKAEKVTNLHFFLHETLGEKTPTAFMVARANITSDGSLFAADDPLKIGPEHNAEVIGNAQGLAVSTSKDTPMVVSYLDFGFTKGKFNGSSISIFSRNPVTQKERELAVVGGRGKFKMAKGFVLFKTYFLNDTILIIECNVTVIH